MPELPEVEGLVRFLRAKLTNEAEPEEGAVLADIELASFTVLKTVSPPATALAGLTVTGVHRHGKFIDLDVDGLHLIFHLAKAGWLRWSDRLAATKLKPGKGPIALRARFELGSADDDDSPTASSDPAVSSGAMPSTGFDLTEAGTRKGLAAYVVNDPQDVPGIASLGPDPLGPNFDKATLAGLISGRRAQIKGLLRSQSVIAGIGNAYSDEILHAAKLSPFASANSFDDEAMDRLYTALHEVLATAVAAADGKPAAELKDRKRAGMRVHGRTGEACPVCGDVVREVTFADSSLQYCATCQTGGKPLADRRTSKFLK
ncbi:DNA-formamidopyrimidine glycosylase family protein [Saxibacter everestensis]|uniref:DNA-formamidopyrimidine glycosylase family protein n=1 Tax=Saxibacter everestensis TaxID=2909229 RepID=A0ABY8QSD6_9MICO|nr:DNA-formamidopyrimidine glycosylase family protein [Brevibacteriaceae bacterium ZFBP1038]